MIGFQTCGMLAVSDYSFACFIFLDTATTENRLGLARREWNHLRYRLLITRNDNLLARLQPLKELW